MRPLFRTSPPSPLLLVVLLGNGRFDRVDVACHGRNESPPATRRHPAPPPSCRPARSSTTPPGTCAAAPPDGYGWFVVAGDMVMASLSSGLIVEVVEN